MVDVKNVLCVHFTVFTAGSTEVTTGEKMRDKNRRKFNKKQKIEIQKKSRKQKYVSSLNEHHIVMQLIFQQTVIFKYT